MSLYFCETYSTLPQSKRDKQARPMNYMDYKKRHGFVNPRRFYNYKVFNNWTVFYTTILVIVF